MASWRRTHFAGVALIGLLASVACVLFTAPLQSHGARLLLGPWWSATAAVAPWHREPHPFLRGGLIVVTAVLALVAAWIVGAWVVVRERISTRVVAWVAALWAAPFAVAPPVVSQDAYAYLAHGAVARAAGSPYRSPQAVLGAASPLLHAVDPLYRSRVSPYGPLALRLFEACLWIGRGNGVGALICLRTVLVLAIAVTAWCGWQLAAPGRRALTVWLLAASPLILLHLVGGLHLEAVLAALLAVAFVLHARGATRWAIVVVVGAAAVKLPAVMALPALVLASWRDTGRKGLATALAAAGAAVGVLIVVLRPDPFGWVPALKGTLRVWNPISLPTVAALTWATLSAGSPFGPLSVLRLVSVAAGVLWAGYLCLTAGRRGVAATAGYVLAAVTLTGPVLWPWYLAPAVVCLIIAGGRRQFLLAAALAAAASLIDLPMPVIQLQRVSVVAEGAALLTTGVMLILVRRRDRGHESAARPRLKLTVP